MYFPIITGETKLLPIYMTGMGCQEDQEPIVRPEGYNYYQISYCSQGEGVFWAGDTEYLIQPGTVFYFAPQVPHRYIATRRPWKVHWVVFDGAFVPKAFRDAGLTDYGVHDFSETALMEDAFRELDTVSVSGYPAKEMECSALLYHLVVKTGKFIQYLSVPQNIPLGQRLSKVTAYMEKNLSGQPTLEELAAVIGVSSFYLCRLFKKLHHTTPFQYLIKLRMQRAKQLLCQHPARAVKDIGQACGFNDSSYFCAVFKQEEGVSPGDFRRMHGV